MKIVIPIFIVIAVGLIIYNLTFIDLDNLFAGESQVALIGILTALCVIVLLLIFRTSKQIEKKHK